MRVRCSLTLDGDNKQEYGFKLKRCMVGLNCLYQIKEKDVGPLNMTGQNWVGPVKSMRNFTKGKEQNMCFGLVELSSLLPYLYINIKLSFFAVDVFIP